MVQSGRICTTEHRNHWTGWKFSRFFDDFHGKRHILMTRLVLLFGLSIQLVSNAKQHSRMTTSEWVPVTVTVCRAPSAERRRERSHTHLRWVCWEGSFGCTLLLRPVDSSTVKSKFLVKIEQCIFRLSALSSTYVFFVPNAYKSDRYEKWIKNQTGRPSSLVSYIHHFLSVCFQFFYHGSGTLCGWRKMR